MKTSLSSEVIERLIAPLKVANANFSKWYPGEPNTRQPVHTLYGGAHLFKSDSARKVGQSALNALSEYAPNFVGFARALKLRGWENLPNTEKDIASLKAKLDQDALAVRSIHEPAWFAHTIYQRVVQKLETEPVEDFRIDFEDGYGHRPDAEEDAHAHQAAIEVAKGMKEKTLPPFIGIRIKPFTEELKMRGIRTLDLFLTTLVQETSGQLPDHFVVTLPKVTTVEQIKALILLFETFESQIGLPARSLKFEFMVETTQSIINVEGNCPLPQFVASGKGRCTGVHFGVYDYTASCNITAAYQTIDHAVCDLARQIMQVSLMGMAIWLSDGATNIIPVGTHRMAQNPLTYLQRQENQEAVHRAWKLGFDHVRHSLANGFYQGWDLHPAQIPIRYAAIYSFFLESSAASALRLKTFVEKAAQATLIGDVFDDAATGQGLLNFFLRGLNCKAMTEEEAKMTGLTLEEIQCRSFAKILNARRTQNRV